MRVIIAGAGDLGLQVLRDLSEAGKHEIVIVEVDEQRAEEVAGEFDALVIGGDAANPDILQKAQIDAADALVAVTGTDAINTVIAMLGHRFHVEQIIVKLTSNSLRGALEEIGVTDIVAPTMAAASRIQASLHGGGGDRRYELIPGRLQIAEITVGRGGAATRIGDLDVPDGVLLVSVARGDDAGLARADTGLEEGDVIIAVAESDDALASFRARVDGSRPPKQPKR